MTEKRGHDPAEQRTLLMPRKDAGRPPEPDEQRTLLMPRRDPGGESDADDQRTLLMPRKDQGSELKPGHKLQEMIIERLLHVGAYSVVYLARDTRLDRRVALKEYLPATLAARSPTGEVAPRLPRFAEPYNKGLQGFLNEARLLGSLEHRSLVRVFRFWGENGTAYMAMPYYEGITLKRWLTELGATPSEKWLRQLADPLVEALSVMHAQRVYHRDVAPDNILMLYDRQGGGYLEQKPSPVLLDFGAARRVIDEGSQELTTMLKSGYSPIEQYGSDPNLQQGPWTDVYALAAVLYTAIAGHAPGSSIARTVRDELPPARELGKGRYGESFLAAIDAGLTVRPEGRPQSMAAWRQLFDAPAPALAPAPVPAAAPAVAAAAPARPLWHWLAAIGVGLLAAIAFGAWLAQRR